MRTYVDILKAKIAVVSARVTLYAWDESKHPRVPSGSSDGGQFGTGGATEPVIVIPAGQAAPGFKIPPPKGFVKDIQHPSGLFARKMSSGEWVVFKPQGAGEPGLRLGVAANPKLVQVLMDRLGKK